MEARSLDVKLGRPQAWLEDNWSDIPIRTIVFLLWVLRKLYDVCSPKASLTYICIPYYSFVYSWNSKLETGSNFYYLGSYLAILLPIHPHATLISISISISVLSDHHFSISLSPLLS